MCAFLHVQANSKEICEEYSFPSFSWKMLTSVPWGPFLEAHGNYRAR